MLLLFLASGTTMNAQTHSIDSMCRRIYNPALSSQVKTNLLQAISMQRSMNLDTLNAYILRMSAMKNLSFEEQMKVDIGRVYYYVRMGRSDSSMQITERN
ncbi:MAG: hypothetical protein EOP49_18585, partial [Sphingobacteriales bacterium]